MSASFIDQRIVILGGTSGLGFATAKAALDQGAHVIVTSSQRTRVDAAVAALRAAAPEVEGRVAGRVERRVDDRVEGRVTDLSDEARIRELFATIGAFDHLVYTAGESLRLAELPTLDLAEAQAAWNLRFWGALAAAKYGSPHIKPGGSIVLTTGIAKDRPLKGWTNAASICGAVDALTRALAIELAPIRVNAVAPGVVRTPLWDNLTDDARDALYRDLGAKLPVGRVGEAHDIAQTYLYLMREAFSTGQTITVDGGTLLV